MELIEDVDQLRRAVRDNRRRRVGFVPTMGALHAGHLSLAERARAECGFVVVSIFVNPTQFAPGEDLADYPRPREADHAACRDAGVDVVFEPSVETMYPSGFATTVEVSGLSAVLEGRHRPTHFRGVTTVVAKLLNLVQPDVAYFGRKDFQQLQLVRRMCRDLNLPIEIVGCPTTREPDGLAMSSRNVYLSPEERERALSLHRELERVRDLAGWNADVGALRREFAERLAAEPGIEVDYATIVDPDTLEEIDTPRAEMIAVVAARVGSTRLIDNVLITLSERQQP